MALSEHAEACSAYLSAVSARSPVTVLAAVAQSCVAFPPFTLLTSEYDLTRLGQTNPSTRERIALLLFRIWVAKGRNAPLEYLHQARSPRGIRYRGPWLDFERDAHVEALGHHKNALVADSPGEVMALFAKACGHAVLGGAEPDLTSPMAMWSWATRRLALSQRTEG